MEDQDRTYELRLVAEPERFAAVRRIVQAHLRYWGLAPLVDPALLGLTELLSNVHEHARSGPECLLRLSASAGCVTVSVHDGDPSLPECRAADPWELAGRGLTIIAAMSKEWGASTEPDSGLGGKVVWFSVATEAVRLVRPPQPSSVPRAERTPAVIGRVAATAPPRLGSLQLPTRPMPRGPVPAAAEHDRAPHSTPARARPLS
jgi:hypothetical protein